MKTAKKITIAILIMNAAVVARADTALWQSWSKGKFVAPYQAEAIKVSWAPTTTQRPQAISVHWQGFEVDLDQPQTLPYQGEKSPMKLMPYYPASEAFAPVPLSGSDSTRF